MSNRVNLIIVDDSPHFVEAIGMFLGSRNKYSILGKAYNGNELLLHPCLKRADVILMDCEMPVMNGIEAARRVNCEFPYKKMIAVTMYNDRRSLLELLGAGFNGYIYKPEITAKVESVIERVLNNEYVFDEKIGVPEKNAMRKGHVV